MQAGAQSAGASQENGNRCAYGTLRRNICASRLGFWVICAGTARAMEHSTPS